MQALQETPATGLQNAITATSSTEPAAADATAVDFQNFLQLLTAQLRNQDPLSPADSTEFVAQLASFSTVEQLVSANNRLDEIAASIVGDALQNYAPWIGRQAEIAGGPVQFNGDPIGFRVAENPAASRIEAIITAAAGTEIDRFTIRDASDVQSWDGVVDGQPARPGAYRISAAYFADDAILSTEAASVFAVVEGVRLTSDGVELRLSGGGAISPDNVVGLSDASDQ